MTAVEWLVGRTAAAPEQLRDYVLGLASKHTGSGDPADLIADASIQALNELLGRDDESRAIACDLLAIDALVTYACEAAVERWQPSGDDPDVLLEWCDRFAVRIGAIAAAHGTP